MNLLGKLLINKETRNLSSVESSKEECKKN